MATRSGAVFRDEAADDLLPLDMSGPEDEPVIGDDGDNAGSHGADDGMVETGQAGAAAPGAGIALPLIDVRTLIAHITEGIAQVLTAALVAPTARNETNGRNSGRKGPSVAPDTVSSACSSAGRSGSVPPPSRRPDGPRSRRDSDSQVQLAEPAVFGLPQDETARNDNRTFGQNSSAPSSALSSAPSSAASSALSSAIRDEKTDRTEAIAGKSAPTPFTPAALEAMKRRPSIDKFDSESTMPATIWMVLFEQTTDGLTDQERTALLLTHISKDALRWYGQFVSPKRSSLSWPDVREMFLAKFARTDANPTVAAKNRTLQSRETVQSYFDDKTRLMELADQPLASMLALLTDGMPSSYRDMLVSREPQSLAEWVRVARNFETTRPKQDNRSVNVANVITTRERTNKPGDGFKRKYDDSPPTTPCPRCLAHGKTEFHWARTCSYPPRNPAETVPKTASQSLNSRSGPHVA